MQRIDGPLDRSGRFVGQILRPACNAISATLIKYIDENITGDGPIRILQVDVKGIDDNVIFGAGKEVLERVGGIP